MASKRQFDPARYLGLSQDHLVVTALLFLLREKRQPSFENLVAEAFTALSRKISVGGISAMAQFPRYRKGLGPLQDR